MNRSDNEDLLSDNDAASNSSSRASSSTPKTVVTNIEKKSTTKDKHKIIRPLSLDDVFGADSSDDEKSMSATATTTTTHSNTAPASKLSELNEPKIGRKRRNDDDGEQSVKRKKIKVCGRFIFV
jgi:hypothetical protein